MLFLFALITFASVFFVGWLPFVLKLRNQPRVLESMTALAAGALIASALLVAVPEGFGLYLHAEQHAESSVSSAWLAGGALMLGFLMLLLLEGFGFGHDLHEEHHDHEHDHGHGHLHHPKNATSSLIIGLGLHSLLDGLAVGAAFALGELSLSIVLLVVVLMHRFPAVFSLAVFSLHERDNKKKSLIDVLFFSLAMPAAFLAASYFLTDLNEGVLGLLLLFSAGSFIYVATVDVLPNIHIVERSKSLLWLVVLGMTFMTLLSFALTTFFYAGH